MMVATPFAPPADGAVAVGMGRLTLDAIVREGMPPRAQGGGTCGNVLTDLAYLGWRSLPLTDLGDDDPGARYAADLVRWGVELDLVRFVPGEETPIIVHHVREGFAGATHSFSSHCPVCGYRLRYFEPVPLAEVEARLPLVPTPRVFFFDRDSPGSLRLAGYAKERGALVVYEPNYAGPETSFAEACAVADVLKFSQERLPDLHRSLVPGPSLVIETRGVEGLRYRRDGDWHHLPAFRVTTTRDAGGSGDWCTAGLIHCLAQEGVASFQRATPEEIRDALRFGQAMSAWNCAFVGARGGVYAVDCARFERDVSRILAGEVFDPAEGTPPDPLDDAGGYCPVCRAKERQRIG
jgi:sugar/nucleoside kinase (ribokinase family)